MGFFFFFLVVWNVYVSFCSLDGDDNRDACLVQK